MEISRGAKRTMREVDGGFGGGTEMERHESDVFLMERAIMG